MSASITMALLASPESALVAAESGSSDADALWLLGPIAGIGFYVVTYLRYRNVDKRHAYERETTSVVTNPTAQDRPVGSVTGVDNSRISGDNSDSPRSRLGGHSSWSEQ